MSFKLASMESFSFDGEEIGAAAAAGLRKVRTLADSAPSGRLFAAIATLNDLSASTTQALEQGNLAKAKSIAADLAKSGEAKLPRFFKRKA